MQQSPLRAGALAGLALATIQLSTGDSSGDQGQEETTASAAGIITTQGDLDAALSAPPG